LKHGAEAARSDDSSSLKKVVAQWLNERSPPPRPPIKASLKSRRGLYNDATAELLCPVEYDWSDKRKNIRGFHPKFLVSAYHWPRFLYKGGLYDRGNPSKGLFKGEFLLMAFKHIFTSPSSTSPDEAEDKDEPPCNRHKLMATGQAPGRSHVAALLGMKAVQPRAIAYVAVQLQFSLSSCKSWRNNDAGFEHDVFYNHIVNWFEHSKDSRAKARVDEVLLWWNRSARTVASLSHYPDHFLPRLAISMDLEMQQFLVRSR
ncbi:hypothetical protein PAXINDRAFT_87389, partial [Paxillus involutus ATCC 200175]